ncbi:Rik1-associated factor [Lachnellula subtilissima]|uniref:Rik1-associated factor n=1 Tax=Lachnellula subtilissima TaxID=602034 RepID=A0A8H8RJF3_9HELO|nr:Rik1-associated factor [Lachnellula subtilissima]
MAATRAYLTDRDLIDLTLSDDDASDQAPQRVSRISASQAQMIDALPVSHDGLPGPHSPDSATRLHDTTIAYRIGDGLHQDNNLQHLAAGPSSADSANARAPLRFPVSTRSSVGAHTRGVISSGRRKLSTGNAIRSGAVGAENPAKRRKTHGGVSSGQSNRSTRNAGSRDGAHTTSQAAQNNEFQINLVLKRQVFPHIKMAVSQCQQRLSDEERAEVGEKTAGFLVKDPRFIKNFVANGLKLSMAYENDLAARAKIMVDQYAREMSMTSRSNSTASETAGDILEEPPILPKHTSMNSTNSRKYSSSPATSFSHDGLDLGDSVNSETLRTSSSSHQKTRHDTLQPAARRRSSRRPVVLIRSTTPAQIKDSSETTKRLRTKSRESAEITPASRPYVHFAHRFNRPPDMPHVDFSFEETLFLCTIIDSVTGGRPDLIPRPADKVISLMAGQKGEINRIQEALQQKLTAPGPGLGRQQLRSRKKAAIAAFLKDAAEGLVTTGQWVEPKAQQSISHLRPSILSQLSSREFLGLAPPNFNAGQGSFKEQAMSYLEDNLTRVSEWTDCCGDIAAISWTGQDTFVCGAVAHSDFYNMQYNKPGNLAVGSLSFDTLKAIPEHRIVRPLIGPAENAENASESMRRTQDPWLYTSVVSSSHNEVNGFTFTASFDKTVKVWSVADHGSNLDLRGTWEHDNNVNFVVTSEHHDRVATAADSSNNAIRVYNVDDMDVSNSPYDTYSGERAREQAQELRRRDSWAYLPATMQWGKAPIVANYLLVGYSPRSITGHDVDIPEEKKNTGELCIWDVSDMSRVAISSAHSQNAFEVVWHPSQPFFIAATSPTGHFESDIRTQVRLFARKGLGAFFHLKTLDCPALDINELTMMPNSDIDSWVTASCTDGNTYVWDTAHHTERPIHVLNHGDSLDNPLPDLPREIGDEGVKFASWGRSSQRFYTGSSDGRVKAWNIHEAPGNALVRHVLEVSGGISVGAFSRDFSKLLVGDATGKVHLLAYDDSDLSEGEEESSKTDERPTFIPAGSGPLRKAFSKRPKVIIPHPEPPPPLQYVGESYAMESLERSAQELALEFLVQGRLRLHPDSAIGAVQGPNYAETKLYRMEAHEEGDALKPLLPEFQTKQQYEKVRETSKIGFSELPTVQCSDPALHARNESLDLTLEGEGVDFNWNYGFEREPTPHFAVFDNKRQLKIVITLDD